MNCKGYSLIELLTTITIVGIIMAPMTVFFISNYTTYYTETAKIDAQAQLRAGMDRIMTDLRRADNISIENDNGEKKIRLDLGDRIYRYYKQKNINTDEIIVYQEINEVKNQLVYNVRDFVIEEERTDDGKLQSVTVTMEVWVNKAKEEFVSLTNMHKIRY